MGWLKMSLKVHTKWEVGIQCDTIMPSLNAIAAVQEREEMVRYVTEEVDRVKSLFQEKESRLMSELDSAKEASKAASQECQALQEQLSAAQAKLATVTTELEVAYLLPNLGLLT